MKYQEQLVELLRQDLEFMEVFNIINAMHLPQAYVSAGAVRDFVWNKKHQLPSSLVFGNIDVFYYDASESNEDYLTRQTQINQRYSKYLWNLVNIALPKRHANKLVVGKDIFDTVQHFPETCSSVAVSCDRMNNISVVAPYGLEDLFELRVKATDGFAKGQVQHEAFQRRINRKKWARRWPNLVFID